MMNKDVFLKDLRNMLGSSSEFGMESDLLDIEDWNSLSAMSFISMAEEKYRVKIEPFEIAEAILVEDLYDIISKK